MLKQPTIRIVRDDGLGQDNPAFVIDGSYWSVAKDGLEGFDGLTHEVSTGEYAQYDGGYLLAERTGTVDRTISALSRFMRLSRGEARDEAERFFIPGRSYQVHVAYAGHERFCEGRQYAFSLPLTKGETQTLDWTLLCLDPYFMSEDEKSIDVVEASKRRGFPFVSCLERVAPKPDASIKDERHVAGFVVGVIQNRISMRNDGHTLAYPRFDVRTTGEVVKPSIRVLDASGAAVVNVGMDITMQDGDSLVIDFTKRPTSVLLNGENASAKVSSGSTLAAGIPVGAFHVEWYAESGAAALSVVPSIRERYTCI